MEDLVIRYENKKVNSDNFIYILDDGSVIKLNKNIDRDFSGYDLNELQEKTNDAIMNKYIVKSYKDVLEALKQQQKREIPILYFNVIVSDYLVVFKQEFLLDEKILLSYKFENKNIENVFRTLLGNNGYSFSIASYKNKFNWIGTSEALEVMLVSAMLDANNITKFEKHHKKKKNGKVRIYYAPNDEIKEALRNLNTVLQRAYDNRNNEFQVAYKKGKSVYDNAKIHKDKKFVFNIDLKDFYPSCKRELVAKYIDFLFKGAPNKDETINAFLDIILIDDGLFIGNPISGCLANTILSKTVAYIRNTCKKHDMEFSIYADDMSFSSDKFIYEDYIKSMFADAFTTYGLDQYFTLNNEKSIGYSGCNRKVTGVSINQNNDITVSRRYYRTLRTTIAHLAKGDCNMDINKLRGKIAYATMIDDSGKIYRYLSKFRNTVDKYKLCSDEKMEELKKKFEGGI